MSRPLSNASVRPARSAPRCCASRLKILFIAIGLLVAVRPVQAAEQNLSDFKTAQQKCLAAVGRMTAATVGIINPDLAGPNALGHGSGVIVSEDGIVLTAAHVLGKPNSELIVVFSDGRRVPAIALGADRSRDAGMAKITEKGKYPFCEMGKSGTLKPGDWCLAMGHPGGIQEGRTPPLRLGRILFAGKGTSLHDCLASDATIISGDSGGPLFDLDGRVLGIHSSISMMFTQNNHVPIDVYQEVWKDLLAGKQTGQLASEQAGPGKLPPEALPQIVDKFQRMMRQKLRDGDPEARDLLLKGVQNLDAKKIVELVTKWEAQGAGDTKLDVLRFHRLLEDHLMAGDHDVQALIKDGKLLLSANQMQNLMEKWEMDDMRREATAAGFDLDKFHRTLLDRALAGDLDAAAHFKHGGKSLGSLKEMKELAAKWEKEPLAVSSGVSTGDLDEFLKHVKFFSDGRIDLSIGRELTGKFMPLLARLGLAPMQNEMQSGKGRPAALATLSSVVAATSPSVVEVLCDGKSAGLGTVVRNDGYIVTKASELTDKITCKVGGRELPATVVKKNDEFDLALLKVDADNLTPVVWGDGDVPRIGTWLAVPGADGKPLALGVVSIAPRAIPKEPIILVKNSAALGVQLGANEITPKVEGLRTGGPADKAGLKAGDVIVALNGKAVANSGDARAALSQFKPGDKITVDIKRGEEKKQMTVELGSAGQLSAPPGELAAHKLDALSSMGGTVSKRNNNFPLALTHDAVLQASQCGGPIVDLDSRIIGLNIARADRTATYAIPAAKAKSLIADMLPK